MQRVDRRDSQFFGDHPLGDQKTEFGMAMDDVELEFLGFLDNLVLHEKTDAVLRFIGKLDGTNADHAILRLRVRMVDGKNKYIVSAFFQFGFQRPHHGHDAVHLRRVGIRKQTYSHLLLLFANRLERAHYRTVANPHTISRTETNAYSLVL